MNFGKRLKKLREEKGMTQEELGKVFGLTDIAILQYEKGKRRPDLEKFKEICEYFEVDPAYLLGMIDVKNNKNNININFDKNNKVGVNDLQNILETIYKKIDDIKK
jgi:transcriptional regulator with XRE-family HTH domain